MLGDIHMAEPGALIGFAGPRVIENTIREKLPEGFQRAEYLVDHGMVDMVVHRHKIRDTLARVLKLLTRRPARVTNFRPSHELSIYGAPMLQAAQAQAADDRSSPPQEMA